MRHDARRVAIAVAIFLVVGAGSVLAAGITETSSIVAGPLPPSFRLAEARVGDSGVYVWDRVRVAPDGNVTVLNEHEIVGFEWLPPGTASDQDGVRHEALMLHQWGWQPNEHRRDLADVPPDGWERYAEPVYAIDLATDRILSYSYLSEATADPSAQGNTGHSAQRMFLGPDDRFLPACGPDSPFSGREVPLDRSVQLFRACQGFANVLAIDAHAPLRAAGTQRLGEHDAILFSSERGDLHVWYDPAIPVPLRVAAASCDDRWSFGLAQRCARDEFDVLRLKEFSRGETPLPDRVASSVVSGPAPSWELAPLRDGLADERGIEHPFPASAALAAVRADPKGAAFRDVLDRGYVSFLDFRASTSIAGEIRVWDMSAYDGERVAAVRVEQRTEQSAGGPAAPSFLPGMPPAATAPPTWTTRIIVEPAADRSNNPQPRPQDAPKEAPTVASMWERWRAFASDEYAAHAPNTWGMRIICIVTTDGECSVVVERWAGVESQTETAEGWTSVTSVLSESHNAERGHEMTMRESSHAPDPDAQPVSVQSRAAKGELTLIQSRVWIAPAAPVVVGSALGAALLSVAYLLLPGLRTAVALFYTRHSTPPDVLRNPERMRMMAAIRERPGLSVQELTRVLGRGRSPTEHHLAMLRRVGLVRIAREGSRRHVYACDARPREARDPALASDVAREILDLRRARPDLGARELARTLGVSPGTISYHVARLRDAGLLPEGGVQTKA